VIDLKATGMNTREIHSDLVATLATKVLGYSTLMHWLRQAQPDQFSETALDFTDDAEVDEIDGAILSALEVHPCSSVCDIARPPFLLVGLSTGSSHVHWAFWSAIFVGSRMP
jgi:hypothetical protein